MAYLSEEDVNEIIRKSLKNKNFEILNFNLKNFGSEVTGFLGDHYLLQVNLKLNRNKEETLMRYFVKSAPTLVGTIQYDYTIKTGVFQKEISLYKDIFKQGFKLHKTFVNCNDEDDWWSPRFYYNQEDKLLVLEDIAVRGYRCATERQPLDKHHVLTGLATISRMHATMILLEHNLHEKKLNEVYPFLARETIFQVDNAQNPFSDWFKSTLDSYEVLIDLVDGYSQRQREAIKRKLTGTMREIVEMIKTSKRYLNVLTHGDLWSNNILFKYEEDKPVSAILVDYQLSRYTPPAMDVLNFIYLGTTKEHRDKHLNFYLKFYYEQLKYYLSRYLLKIEDVLTWDEFEDSCLHYKKLAILISVQTLSYVITPKCVSEFAMSTPERYESFIVNDRKYFIKESFKDDLYRIRLSEAYRELVDSYILKKI